MPGNKPKPASAAKADRLSINSGGEKPVMRIAKAIARAGVCSRREAEALIASGRISVNGNRIDSPALNVSEKDSITLDDAPLPQVQGTRLWRFHKPKGTVTTNRDEKGRPTIFDHLPEDMPRTITIGRLDMNTEGLLLLTNDGELARHIELPSTGWLRRYKVRAAGSVTEQQLAGLKKGVTIDGVRYGAVEANLIKVQGANCWFTMALREGKNREVKRISEHLGLKVNRLIRLSFGPFMLGDLAKGEIEEVKPHILADQLGAQKAGEFGLKPAERQPPQPKATGKKPPLKQGRAARKRNADPKATNKRPAKATRPATSKHRPTRNRKG